jgi:hypothetical protein
MIASFDRGMEVEINYPVSTHVRFWKPDECRRREVVIDSVRDLVADPLSVDEFLRRPFLLRSRWLVKAYEPRLRQWRQFYWGSTREFAAPGILRVGLYEPGATKPSWLYGRAFHPTPEDRRELMKSLKEWDKLNFGDMSLKVFADDLPDTDSPAKESRPLMPKTAPRI